MWSDVNIQCLKVHVAMHKSYLPYNLHVYLPFYDHQKLYVYQKVQRQLVICIYHVSYKSICFY